MTTPDAGTSPLQALPDDVLRRLLAGVPRLDHGATAAACQAFRAVIKGPQFLALRRRYGFAESGIVLTGGLITTALKIRTARASGIRVGNIAGVKIASPDVLHSGSTTDGTRLFVCVTQDSFPCQTYVYAVDVSSRKVSFVATIPMNRRLHSIEWHGGCLYFAGGFGLPANERYNDYLRSFQVFNEATGLWGDLPPMPHAFSLAASGVIGNQLFVAGGRNDDADYNLSTLQIFDFTTRTWRLGAPMPAAKQEAIGVVVDGKLFVITSYDPTMSVYDPASDTWSVESNAPFRYMNVKHACAHNGRVIVFVNGRGAFERAAAGTWAAYDLADEARDIVGDTTSWNGYAAESVLLG